MSQWDLYIDESGQLRDRLVPVTVGGALMPEHHPSNRTDHVKALLQNACQPWSLPWPLHANLVNVPVYHALAVAPRDSLCERARATLARIDASSLLAVEGGILRRHNIYQALTMLDEVLKHHDRDCWNGLQDRARHVRAAVARVLKQLTTADTPHPMFIVSAGETRLGDGDEGLRTDFEDSRYLGVLRCAVERAIHVLERLIPSGAFTLRVHILTRDHTHPLLRRRVPLQAKDVSVAFGDLCTAGRVKPVAGVPAEFDDAVHGAAVLADFATNWIRRILRPDRCLADVDALVLTTLTVKARSGVPERSHLAATGRARAAICAVRNGEPASTAIASLPHDGESALWAIEQAHEWMG